MYFFMCNVFDSKFIEVESRLKVVRGENGYYSRMQFFLRRKKDLELEGSGVCVII